MNGVVTDSQRLAKDPALSTPGGTVTRPPQSGGRTLRALVPCGAALQRWRRWSRACWLVVALALAGSSGCLVNGENKFVNLPLLLLPLWWLDADAARVDGTVTAGTHPWHQCVSALAAVLVVVSTPVGEVLRERPRASIFFGPQMQWACATFRRPSPVGQRVW